ncbi:hypothetical protein P4T04_04930 [Bacillus badius]|uniref:hypothetical protein n=1 Tax=Bacillus badius TaxID=1455 RepID=UPI0007B0619C|nr:hypothetical protein [Bacillus badius]KZO00875.1 hypothetical protein A4244_14805 [Bacillus badius]MED0665660.1 hypothetical protein [Bacillus badius]OCS88805.1 hypothetical protein A6M11_14825 [Bacillus badius]OVE49611.1 hypothetical protein B1A98_16565 [Bacillus badius]TDW00991.1 hypothetical protein B0G66_11444 [Bacillus badius]
MPVRKLFQKKDQAALFWQWFAEVQQDYYELPESELERLFDQLDKRLGKVNKQLVFEFSAEPVDGKREFVISADGLEEAFPAVIELVDKAPQLDGFRVTAFRQPSDEEYEVALGGITVSSEDVYFDYLYDPESGLVDVRLFIKNFDPENEAYDDAAFIMLDSVLGEYDAVTKLAAVELRKLHETEGLYPIRELRRKVIQSSK